MVVMSVTAQNKGTFTDSRNNKVYKTIVIGTQKWMAENMNYKTDNSWCYDDTAINCETYGRLYDWEAAKKACPTGWHLPSNDEWVTLINYLGGKDVAGDMLKSNIYWYNPKAGVTATSGFEAFPGGIRRLNASYVDMRAYGYWWSSTEVDANNANYVGMEHLNKKAYNDESNKKDGYSVRCLIDK